MSSALQSTLDISVALVQHQRNKKNIYLYIYTRSEFQLNATNTGGDGLVAARHLYHYGYSPTIFYPIPTNKEIYTRLATQLKNLSIPFTDDFSHAAQSTDHIIDAIFGFSFSGEVRDPFRSVIATLESTKVPVLSVDAPSSWNIEDGPPKDGPGKSFMPRGLISLTAPKPLVKYYRGTHFLGGRFLPPEVAEKYGLEYPTYPGCDQVVDVTERRV